MLIASASSDEIPSEAPVSTARSPQPVIDDEIGNTRKVLCIPRQQLVSARQGNARYAQVHRADAPQWRAEFFENVIGRFVPIQNGPSCRDSKQPMQPAVAENNLLTGSRLFDSVEPATGLLLQRDDCNGRLLPNKALSKTVAIGRSAKELAEMIRVEDQHFFCRRRQLRPRRTMSS